MQAVCTAVRLRTMPSVPWCRRYGVLTPAHMCTEYDHEENTCQMEFCVRVVLQRGCW